MYSHLYKIAFFLLAIFFIAKCESGTISREVTTFHENSIIDSSAAIALGHQLFFDRRLSVDNTIACASCHHPRKAFTDGREKSIGIKDRKTLRNAPTLLNTVDQPHFMLDAAVSSLEVQALVPLRDTAEMGNDIKELIYKLRKIDAYNKQALKAYNREFDPFVLTKSLALFQQTLTSKNAAFDQWLNGDISALSAEAEKGYDLLSGKMNCITCHAFPHFTNYAVKNNGWHETYTDHGQYRVTGDTSDIGAFKVPSLRNIILTAPYMHDGSAKTLDEVLDNYQKGGSSHFNKDQEIKAFDLSQKERVYVMEFFKALTDTSYLNLLTPEERAFE